jgi:predicted nucleic acid-binding Zn ribbon protein
MKERGGPAEGIGALIARFLKEHGHQERVDQAAILGEWAAIAGPQIARVTEALSISPDGTLVVGVATNAWMMELGLHEPQLITQLNEGHARPRVKRIRWQLRR